MWPLYNRDDESTCVEILWPKTCHLARVQQALLLLFMSVLFLEEQEHRFRRQDTETLCDLWNMSPGWPQFPQRYSESPGVRTLFWLFFCLSV